MGSEVGHDGKGALHTVKRGVIDTMKIPTKFPNTRILLVDCRVPSESTTGLANLPAYCADPGTDGCGLHKNGGGKATVRGPEAMARVERPESDGERVRK